MWISVLLILLQAIAVPQGESPCKAAAAAVPSGSPTFVVQAVDPSWEPFAGAKITLVSEVSAKKLQTASADAQGYARFWIPAEGREQTYAIKVEHPGTKKAEVKAVPFPGDNVTAYVQVRLSIDVKGEITVY